MKQPLVFLTAILLSWSFTAPLHGQWLDYKTPGIPRTAKGEPDLAAPAPRAADGKPDLSGIYQAASARQFQDITAGLKEDEFPIQPWAAALAKRREEENRKDDPYSHCLPPGVPRINVANHPFKILQLPGQMAILYETSNTFRQIFTDGRPLPKDPQPTWLGYSVGKWEGDTLVVESTGFSDRIWLDGDKGHPSSDALHVAERFRRTNFGHLEIQVTLDDPKAFTKPWMIKQSLNLLPDTELLENICENERDTNHLVGK
jgi:hypothetical protein